MSSHKNNCSRDPRAAQGSTPGPHSGPIWSQVNPILRFVRLHFGSIPRQFGLIRTNSDQFGAILDQRATWYSNVVFWFPTWYFGFQRGIVVFQRGIVVSNVVFWFPTWYFGIPTWYCGFQRGIVVSNVVLWYSNVVFWFPTWYFGFQRGIVVFQRGILVSNVVFWFPMWYFGFQCDILLARDDFPPVQIHFPTLYFAFHRLKIFLNRCRKTS